MREVEKERGRMEGEKEEGKEGRKRVCERCEKEIVEMSDEREGQ